MSTGRRVGVAVALLAGVLLVVLLSKGGCQSQAPPPTPPTATATASAPARATATAKPRRVADVPTLSIGPGSKVTLSGIHAGRPYTGSFTLVSGALRLDGNEVAGGSLEVKITTTSVTAKSPELTKDLKSAAFLEAARNAQVRFMSTLIGPSASDAGAAKHDVTGNLTLHGVLKSIHFVATVTNEGAGRRLEAKIPIDRKDFGIVGAGKPGDPFGPRATLALDLKLVRKK